MLAALEVLTSTKAVDCAVSCDNRANQRLVWRLNPHMFAQKSLPMPKEHFSPLLAANLAGLVCDHPW